MNDNFAAKTFSPGAGLTKSSVAGVVKYRYNVTKDLEAFGLHEVFQGYVHRRHPQYFIPLHSIHTLGNLTGKISFS